MLMYEDVGVHCKWFLGAIDELYVYLIDISI